jgi:tetratricopeptide (TPR) repeat protein
MPTPSRVDEPPTAPVALAQSPSSAQVSSTPAGSPTAPSPYATRPSRPATLIDSFPRLEAAQRLSEHPRFRVKGISPPIAALFVGIAVVQGLLAAAIYKYVHRAPAPDVNALASAVAFAASARSRAPALEASSAAVPTNRETAPANAAAPKAVQPASAAHSGTDASPVEEPATPAPSCEELLGASASGGDNVGAAFEQLKIARKMLVQGKADEAQRAYCKAVRWDAQNANYYFELAQLLLIRRDGAAAADWARRGLKLEPTSTKGQSLVGDGLARVGDSDGARRAWYAAASVNNPSNEEVQQLFLRAMKEAEQALSGRDYMRAERFFRRAVILDSKNAAAHRGLAVALLRAGEVGSALRWAKRAAELAANDPAVQLTLGDALRANGDESGARNAWLEAERLGYPDARRRLSHLDKKP